MSQLIEYLKSIGIFIIVNTLKYEVTANIYMTIYYPTIIMQLRYYRSDTNVCNVYAVNRMTSNKLHLTKIIHLP